MKINKRKAQVQLGESIFIVIFIILIIVFGIIFFSGAEKDSMTKQAAKYDDLSTVALAQFASSLSELACSKHEVEELSCYDLSKVEAFASLLNNVSLTSITREYYFTQLGNAKLEIDIVYSANGAHQGEHILLYFNDIYPGTEDHLPVNGQPILMPISLFDPVSENTLFGVMTITKYTRFFR